MKTLIATLTAGLLLAGPLYAQDTTPAPAPASKASRLKSHLKPADDTPGHITPTSQPSKKRLAEIKADEAKATPSPDTPPAQDAAGDPSKFKKPSLHKKKSANADAGS